MLETFDIKGVEIFSTGEWNGDDYTMDDLKSMVSNFDELRSGLKPYLKLGHDDNQKLIQTDGLPACGWIDRLYIMGEKLVADFSQIPKTIYELIESGGYKKVSSEIYWDLKIGEKVYGKVLAAVALLGSDTPAVMNLKDILAMYREQGKDLRVYDFKEFNIIHKEMIMPKTEAEIKLEFDLKIKEEQLEEVKKLTIELGAEKAEYTKKLADLESYKAKAEAEKQELLAKAEEAQKEQFMTELVSEKLMSPSMKENVEKLYSNESKETLKELLKFAKELSTVNFDESSVDDAGTKKDDFAAKDKAVKAHMAENKVSYGVALKAINKQSKK